MPIAWHWLSSHHVIATTDTFTTIEELLEAVFSVQSVQRLCNKDQLPLQKSFEMAVRKEGGWCEMAASMRVSQSRESLQTVS
jgi:hypothetical protein